MIKREYLVKILFIIDELIDKYNIEKYRVEGNILIYWYKDKCYSINLEEWYGFSKRYSKLNARTYYFN